MRGGHLRKFSNFDGLTGIKARFFKQSISNFTYTLLGYGASALLIFRQIHKKLTPWGGGTYANFLINQSHCDRGKVFQAINFKLHIHTFGVWGQCSIDFQADPTKIDPVEGSLVKIF